MALSILDGNQSATTLSTIVTSGQHIPAHTIVSLGTQAVTDISTAVGLLQSAVATQGSVANTAFVKIGGHTGTATTGNIVHVSSVGAMKVDASASTQPISGTVTANVWGKGIDGFVQLFTANDGAGRTYDGGGAVAVGFNDNINGNFAHVSTDKPFPIQGTVTIGSALPAGTNRIGVVTIGAGTVTIGAGTAQIGSVTASISGTVPISISSVTVGNSVTIGSLPALAAGTAQIGSVTASISNTVVTIYSAQGTTVTNSNFTSTTASTTLVSAVAGRDVLTVFNEGAGNLHISPGATCTTVAYQVRLSSGDYWECPEGQRSLAHTAVFATAGTARVTEVS
jgi:hypothetical protein